MALKCPSSSFCPPNFSPYSNSSFPAPLIPVPSLRYSPLSHKLSIGGNWVSIRNRFCVKSADPDSNSDQISQETVSASSNVTSFLSLLCPLLKLFSGGDPSQNRNYALEVVTSSLSTLARLPWGSRSLSKNFNNQKSTSSPPKPLQLFEFEACPFCRRVREALTELDLSAEVYPCPKGSVRHREMVRKIGGKEQFPFLIDPNTGISLYESGDIVEYLFHKYGEGRSPSIGLLESTLFTGWMPTIFRAGRGMIKWERAKSEPPLKKLELFSYENNPYARIVREALCELELPYIIQNAGAGSQRKNLLLEVYGSQEIPFFVDPNTGAQIDDYKKILAYLFETYSTA